MPISPPRFTALADKARGDALGHQWLNLLTRNGFSSEAAFLQEHTPDGLHNAQRVARLAATIGYNGVDYFVHSDDSGFIDSVSKTAAGECEVSLSPGIFTRPAVVMASTIDDEAELVPIITNYRMVSEEDSTELLTVIVRTKKLNALGANVWADFDGQFSLAIWSLPYASAAAGSLADIARYFNGNTLGAERWNELVARQAAQRVQFLVGHTAAGAHNTRDVARGLLQATFLTATSGGYDPVRRINVGGLTRASTGVVDIALPGASVYATPLQIFPQPGYQSLGSPLEAGFEVPHIVNFWDGSVADSACQARIYGYDAAANAWSRADADFGILIHSGAV